jgi:tetratricopeptide (TPR) repeat protein
VTAQLARIASLAYGRRNIKVMEHAGKQLAVFDKDAGLYYLAIAARWKGRAEEARALLETVRGPYEARAIHALGAIHFGAGQFDEAARFYIEAMRANKGRDAFAVINAQFQASAIKSAHGDHREALDDLHSLWPVVKVAAKHYPHLWPALHNELAYELLQLGRVAEARQAARIAVESHIAESYPEWRETAAEVKAATSQTILVVVPARPTEQRSQSKVIIRFLIVESSARRRVIKPTIGRAPIIRSIIERVATVAPIHAPPAFLM